MDANPSDIIDALGGTSAVAKMIEAPISTVHSWRTIGIPASRLAHLKLAAEVHGKADALALALAGKFERGRATPDAQAAA